jgi:hypothetical protein
MGAGGRQGKVILFTRIASVAGWTLVWYVVRTKRANAGGVRVGGRRLILLAPILRRLRSVGSRQATV